MTPGLDLGQTLTPLALLLPDGAYLPLMARRPSKLAFHEHSVTCPYCRADITIYSLMEHIIAARRICPKGKREMMIDNGKAVRLSAEGEKKPPKQVRSHISKAKG